jgi:glycosyltransferase involved in cell wall biosynthesis
MTAMRIVVAHNRYRSAAPSGENRVVDTECDALVGHGHEVIRFERHSDEIESWSAARKATLPARVVWNPGPGRDLRSLLASARPDVVHLHNTFPLLSASVLHACRNASVPVVATIHNYKLACASGDFFRAGSTCHDCGQGSPLPGLVHGCYRGSRLATAPVALSVGLNQPAWRSLVSAYVFISAAQRDLLSGLRLPPERSFVKHNLIPRRLATVTSAREAMVVYAGRLDEAKGARVLMAAWDRFLAERSSRPGLRLVIAGSGPLAGEMTEWAGTRPSVELTGILERSRCVRLMGKARAVVLPSAWEETFGLTAIEAMAVSTPPIAPAHGSFPELISADTDGMLFTAGDPGALAKAFADAESNPERFLKLGARARETYERRFNPERNLRQLEDIYQYAVNNPALPATRTAIPNIPTRSSEGAMIVE